MSSSFRNGSLTPVIGGPGDSQPRNLNSRDSKVLKKAARGFWIGEEKRGAERLPLGEEAGSRRAECHTPGGGMEPPD